jgi:ubiquinone/menaquinone biosynthesis C-methylase UbiE
MALYQEDLNKFMRGIEYENALFWSRISEKPVFNDTTVLEIGCGWGSLSVEMALEGSVKVIGLDINSKLIKFADENLQINYSHLKNIVEFKDIEIKEYFGELFDIIISKDSFEHIIELEATLVEMKRRLKAGGRLYAGFGPLYQSPYGDHDRRLVGFRPWGFLGKALAKIPWGHLVMEPLIIKMQGKHLGKNINSIYELGLNKISVSDFREMITRSGFNVVAFRVNQSSNVASKIFTVFRKIPFLENYFTHNVYCILEKSA